MRRYILFMRRSQAEKHKDLISATLACVDEHGTHAVRLRDVAERAGVSKAWILTIYPSRSALIGSAVGDRFSRRVTHTIGLLTALATELDSAEAFITRIENARRQSGYPLDREEVWQFFEVLVWSLEDVAVDIELAAAKKRVVGAYERLTTALDDRGWLHGDTGPVSVAILLMASSLARMRLGSQEVTGDAIEESLLLVTLRALLVQQDDEDHRPDDLPGMDHLLEYDHPTAGGSDGDVVRERILDAATRELAERGALKFRIRAVVDAAQASTSVVYKHFGNRDALVEQAADRLKQMNTQSVRESLTNALEPSVNALGGPRRDRMVLAVDVAYRSLRSNTPEAFTVGLTALVSGRRIESAEDSRRRRQEYFETVAKVFIEQLGLPASFDPGAYVDIGPLAFFVGVVLVSFPADLDSDVSLGPSVIRVVESRFSTAR